MKYRFYGDKLELIRYEIIISDEQIYEAASETERDELLEHYPDAVVEKIDNIGYEWLDGMIFTQEQLRAGELEKAVEMGKSEFMQYRAMSDPIYRDLDFDLRLALLESGVSIDELSSVY